MRRVTLFLLVLSMTLIGGQPLCAAVPEVKWDKYGLFIDGQRVMPVMGEIHYSRRPYVYPEDAYSMALVKLGSGSNLLGYYMYHGGTNPEGVLHTLNEVQTSPGTANNDLPVVTYDFQAPLGEFGQPYPQYYSLRPLHLFMQDYGYLRLWRLPKGCTKLELRILPLQPNAPIYLPREAEKTAGEVLNTVMISCEK